MHLLLDSHPDDEEAILDFVVMLFRRYPQEYREGGQVLTALNAFICLLFAYLFVCSCSCLV